MIESFCRIVVVTVVSLVWIIMFGFAARNALATGPGATGGTATAGASAGASVSGSATSSGTVDMRAYGVGGTGLTSTAPCLSSVSVLFGLVATTSVEKGCVIRMYAAQCKDDACRRQFACLDPDLMPEAKTVLGCPAQ